MRTNGTERVLICAAHPDDEALGCGGAMARHAQRGDTVHVLFVADGVVSRPGSHGEEIGRRRDSARKAAQILGALSPSFLDFPDQRLDEAARLDITQAIERTAIDVRPTIVYTHHCDDLNADHRRVAEAVMTAFRPTPGQTVRAIYGFETLSSTEWGFNSRQAFKPTRFVDIQATLLLKLEALRAYAQEIRDFPHPRSYKAVEALAVLRGATAGLEAAEAFSVLREIEA